MAHVVLEKRREDRVARLKVPKKRRKSMDGTRNFMRRRRDELKRLVSEQENKLKRLEQGEELEEEGEEGEESELVQDQGEAPDKDAKKIRSWLDPREDSDEENAIRGKKQIRTRFSKEKEGGNRLFN